MRTVLTWWRIGIRLAPSLERIDGGVQSGEEGTGLVTSNDDGSRWSLWSRDSFLSIGSRNSVLSVASVGSVLSIGGVGSAGSVLSIGSFLSVASLMSGLSWWSVMAWRSKGRVVG